jgi:hypothetical protein
VYKDKNKANEAARERMRRYRANQKGVTPEGVTEKGVTPNLELCRTCQAKLPPLEKPRQYPGKCLACVTEGR